MLNLELQQRGLLDLVKSRGGFPDDPYLQRVAASRELMMVREIAIWWRAFQLEAQCRFTSRLLKRFACFNLTVTNYFNKNATSPFIEELSRDFLKSLRTHHNKLIAALSQFEYALLETHNGSDGTWEIVWDRNPNLVILALEKGIPLPLPEPECRYRMRVARDLPGAITCTREFIP